ncbi:MAG: HlyD family efflux transporter periplasmic adaptor subunit, partial [Lachnospiraceae bacterium]|nr:HlyD family efflux transporter periplasmic adaptor subunit [Lachnospiraceae bacterium]
MKERLKKDKKLRRNLILAGLALLILLAAAIYTLFIKPSLDTVTYVYKEEPVSRGDLILGIMESGSLSLGESAIVYDLDISVEEEEEDEEDEEDSSDSEEEETVKYLEIGQVNVVSGQRIQAGDVLFQFTDESVEAVRRKLTSALTEAKIALSNAQTEYNISALSAQSTYDSSKAAGNYAASNYRAALTKSEEAVKSLEAEIKVLEQEIVSAQEMLVDEDLLESYEEAQISYTQAKNKYDETDLHNATAYTSNLSAYQQAESQLETIEEQLQGYRDTITDNQARIEEIRVEIEEAKTAQILENQEAENDYNSAVLEGELAQEIYDYSVNSLSDAVTEAQTEFDEIQAKVDAFESFVGENNQIIATESGLVTNVNYEAEDTLVNTGTMLTYVKEDEYTVSIDVSEEDVAAITIGDTVDLVFTAYPEKTWQGIIVSITTSATSEYASTISYPVTIHVEGDTSLLYGGMTADVTFVTESAEDVLYVSKKAVFEEDGTSYVYKKDESGNRVKVRVETGFSDMTSI